MSSQQSCTACCQAQSDATNLLEYYTTLSGWEADHVSRLCRVCGTLWTVFKGTLAREAAGKEISDGKDWFHDWEGVEVLCQPGTDCSLGVKVWDTPPVNVQEARLFRSDREPEYVVGQCLAETLANVKKILGRSRDFANAIHRMPVRERIPGRDAMPDPYNVAVSFLYYTLFTNPPLCDKLVSAQARVAEMGPHTPKPKFPPSQVMLALAASKFTGEYTPLDWNEWTIMSLLGWHEWSRRHGDLAYRFSELGGIDWLQMGRYRAQFDVLVIPHIVEDFSFCWYFNERAKCQPVGWTGYRATYPYDEVYHARHRAVIHWFKFMEYYCGDGVPDALKSHLGKLARSIASVVRVGGYVLTWQYPAARLLATGLLEEALFEMSLYDTLIAKIRDEKSDSGATVFSDETGQVGGLLKELESQVPFGNTAAVFQRVL